MDSVSRAFIREAETPDPRCPGCGGSGEPVGFPALRGHLPPEEAAALGERAYYCVDPACRTAYFNGWGAAVPVERMTARAAPKDPEAPLCSCFGMRTEEVVADAREGRKDRVRDLVERSRGPEARCAERSPDGLPCVARVLRLFRETFEAR
jgi:hypothetical protein